MILASVVPLISATAGPLLSRVPERLEPAIVGAIARVGKLPEVLSTSEPHFWQHHADVQVGSLHVAVAAGTDRQRTLQRVQAMFKEAGIHDMTVQLETVEYP